MLLYDEFHHWWLHSLFLNVLLDRAQKVSKLNLRAFTDEAERRDAEPATHSFSTTVNRPVSPRCSTRRAARRHSFCLRSQAIGTVAGDPVSTGLDLEGCDERHKCYNDGVLGALGRETLQGAWDRHPPRGAGRSPLSARYFP
ncbi:hypothetical protein [Allonocardiopsis opalescens]|uniref:hypothetical protein n=1 Tax=Allonocardiopsis opalescens TaxID=1144618 RepID=UPI0011B27E9A|nr:hypothetical protein [Allonocardiopsis opalescens]